MLNSANRVFVATRKSVSQSNTLLIDRRKTNFGFVRLLVGNWSDCVPRKRWAATASSGGHCWSWPLGCGNADDLFSRSVSFGRLPSQRDRSTLVVCQSSCDEPSSYRGGATHVLLFLRAPRFIGGGEGFALISRAPCSQNLKRTHTQRPRAASSPWVVRVDSIGRV